MSTLSVPLTPRLEAFINKMVNDGYADNKAQVVRRAIVQMEEDLAVQELLLAQQEIKDGKGIKGDLRSILKNFKD